MSPAISSTTGARTLQGPHQVAWKSTRTGRVDLATSASQFASVTAATLLMNLISLHRSLAGFHPRHVASDRPGRLQRDLSSVEHRLQGVVHIRLLRARLFERLVVGPTIPQDAPL